MLFEKVLLICGGVVAGWACPIADKLQPVIIKNMIPAIIAFIVPPPQLFFFS